jgi:secreted trypsin-like serine protease
MKFGAALFLGCFFFIVSFSSAQTRIVNGQPANPLKWSALGAIVDSNYAPADGQFCAGALVAPRLVLTAGHCLTYINTKTTDIIFKRKDLRFKTGVRRAIVKKIIHPRFNSKTNNYDLGLLYLNKKVSKIRPLPLKGSLSSPGSQLTTAGWGFDSYPNGARTNRLKYTRIKIRSRKTCQRIYPNISRQSFCAGTNKGNDTCLGDSGGPALFKGRVVGVVSRGRGCGDPLFPGIYSRVDLASGWINYHIDNQLKITNARSAKKEKPYKLFSDRPFQEIYPVNDKYQFDFYLYLKEEASSVKIYSDPNQPICIVNSVCANGLVNVVLLTDLNGYNYALTGVIKIKCLNTYYQIKFRDRRFKKIVKKFKICSR